MPNDAMNEAQGYADKFISALDAAERKAPRVAVTSFPRRYRGRDQLATLLMTPKMYYQNHEYRRLTPRSKALCMNHHHASEGRRAVVHMRYDEVQELMWGGKMLVKTIRKNYRYCPECIKRWYGIDAEAASPEWRRWQRGLTMRNDEE